MTDDARAAEIARHIGRVTLVSARVAHNYDQAMAALDQLADDLWLDRIEHGADE